LRRKNAEKHLPKHRQSDTKQEKRTKSLILQILWTERSLYHSKKPGELFIEEAASNIPACLDKAMELYYTLEEKRKEIFI
jgi:hypothetical protein